MNRLLVIFFVLIGNIAFSQVQFKSGPTGFDNFIKEKTVYPRFSKQNCIQGTVNISFKLNAAGEVYYSKISKSVMGDLDDEALRLVRLSSGNWKIPVGYDTTTSITVPVNFVLLGYNCENKSKNEINAAIMAYNADDALLNAVTNFYKNIDKATPGQEAQFITIKNQLGIDDDYLNEKIKSGLAKWKQGDKQGACEDFYFVKYMGSNLADENLKQYCK